MLKILVIHFINLREEINSVKTKKQILLSGSQQYSLASDDQYLSETYIDVDGKIIKKEKNAKRVSGIISKKINLKEGDIFKAELTEFTKS